MASKEVQMGEPEFRLQPFDVWLRRAGRWLSALVISALLAGGGGSRLQAQSTSTSNAQTIAAAAGAAAVVIAITAVILTQGRGHRLDASEPFFREIAVGDTDTQAIALTNTLKVPLTITDFRVNGNNAFTLPGERPSQPIASGGRVLVTVLFSPTSPGSAWASLRIQATAEGGKHVTTKVDLHATARK